MLENLKSVAVSHCHSIHYFQYENMGILKVQLRLWTFSVNRCTVGRSDRAKGSRHGNFCQRRASLTEFSCLLPLALSETKLANPGDPAHPKLKIILTLPSVSLLKHIILGKVDLCWKKLCGGGGGIQLAIWQTSKVKSAELDWARKRCTYPHCWWWWCPIQIFKPLA